MRYLLKLSSIAIVSAAVVAFAPSAVAKDISKAVCQAVGASGQPEPLGDREGHGISVTTESCRVEGGAMDGGNMTGQVIWEWEKTNATLVSVSGVVRKPVPLLRIRPPRGRSL